MKKRKHMSIEKNGNIVLVQRRNDIQIIPNVELSAEEYLKELEELTKSIERIKKEYYSNKAMIERIQDRNFTDIVRARISKLIVDKKW